MSGTGHPHNVGVSSIAVTTDHPTSSTGLLSSSCLGYSDMSQAGSVPPSPTLSSHTANFPATLQPRDNKSDARGSTTNSDFDGATFSETKPTADEEEKPTKKKKAKKRDDATETNITHQREQDESVNPAPFRFKPFQLAHMLDPKDLELLTKLGGTDGVIQGLGTHAKRGLATGGQVPQGAGRGVSQSRKQTESSQSVGGLPNNVILTEPSGNEGPPSDGDDHAPYTATMDDRKRVYGNNTLPTRISKTLLQLIFAAMKDKVLILLSVAAIVSLALGLFQDFGTPRKDDEPPVDWVEGVAIVVAIAIVVIVGSVNDWQKERQFKALNERKEERGVKVIRDGTEKVIDIKEVVVGDIALVEHGEIIPCDGIFISGHDVKCDESGATGESDAIKKLPYADVVELTRNSPADSPHTDCFMISGSKVLEGVGKYVVVAVGTKSLNGRTMMALRTDTENTRLQIKLNVLAESIAKIGGIIGLILFGALMIKYFVQLGTNRNSRTPSEWGMEFVNNLVISITLVVVAVPGGLPLAVTLALAFATKRMTYENLLVRVLGPCETMANVSVICTDKTGTLTQNAMTVVAGSIGIHAKFVRILDENSARTNAEETEKLASGATTRRHPYDFSIDQANLNNVLSTELQELFNEAIAINSTAFEDDDPNTGKKISVGSKTETALLRFAKELDWRNASETRDSANVVQMIPFSSERQSMGVVIKKPQGGYRAYFKGASEILAMRSTKHVTVRQDGNYSHGIETQDIDDLSRENINRTIVFYANQTLRTIAVSYRDFETWPTQDTIMNDTAEVTFDDLAKDLTLIAITGIEDPLREGVREAVLKCQRAGVSVKMCTGDNAFTARSIATQCGILTQGDIIMEGPVFRQLSQTRMIEIVPRLQVLARSSPEDKKVLVETLKMIGEIVGVTGDGTNDGPALKTANVGFSKGIAGTEVAKEASDIILMDDNFSSIVKAIMWGRCVNDSVRKFLQFQILTNVTAVIITFVSALANDPVLTAVQLLWISIIMDTFAALALATDPATEKLLGPKPDKKTAPLFSVEMYKMILLQSVYQIVIILVFHFLGVQILGLEQSEESEAIVKTLVFNSFVFAQIFNSVNCRQLYSQLNVFEGILKNRYFLVITVLEIVIQIAIVFVGGAAFHVTRIGGREWGISLALGFVSIPWGAIIRLLPTKPFESLFKLIRLVREEEVLPLHNPNQEGWGGPIVVRDNLKIFSNIRGGRLRSSSFVRSIRRLKSSPTPTWLKSVAVAVPSLVVIACVLLGRRSTDDPTSPPSPSAAQLLRIYPR